MNEPMIVKKREGKEEMETTFSFRTWFNAIGQPEKRSRMLSCFIDFHEPLNYTIIKASNIPNYLKAITV